MNVLSIFDGMSCGRLALERAGVTVDNYYSSEIDKFAIEVSKRNHKDIIRLGDVTDWGGWDLPSIDLLIGGSPCQGFSSSGKGLNFEDPRSKLFFEFADMLDILKPQYFLLENVVMKKEWEDIITSYMGVSPILLNSSVVSAQNRKRLYWTNIQVSEIVDLCISIHDIIGADSYPASRRGRRINDKGKRSDTSDIPIRQYIEPRSNNKSNCLTTVAKDNVVAMEKLDSRVLDIDTSWRKYTISELEQLQTLPIGYTAGVSDSQRTKMIGNGWTIDIIAHILKGLT